MYRVHGLKAFLAALCVSLAAVDSVAAQDTVTPAEPAQSGAQPSTVGEQPNWLLRGRGQNRIVNPFRATPAPGNGGAFQNPTPVAPVAPFQPISPKAQAAGKAPGCLIGFRRQGSECVAIAIPEHGTLDLTGHGWMCERGFRRVGQSCVAMPLPENAALNEQGNGWVCNYGFRRQAQSCVA